MDEQLRKLLKGNRMIDDLARGIDRSPLSDIASGGSAMRELQRSIIDHDAMLKVSGMYGHKGYLADIAKVLNPPRPWEGAFAATAAEIASKAMIPGPFSQFEELTKSLAGFDRAFRLPKTGEAARLFQEVVATGDAMQSMVKRLGLDGGVGADFARLHIPWVDVVNPMKSITAFASLETLSSISVRGAFGDLDANIFIRQSLGDWRDEMSFGVTLDHVARTTLYNEQGVDPELTDFPEDSFTEIVEVMGLAFNENYAGIAGAVVFDEDGLRRNHDAYDRLMRFEIILRGFIAAVMMKHFGPKWATQRIPPAVLENWRDKRNKAAAAGHRQQPLIEYADFMDYHQIITRSDNWNDVFTHVFVRQEDIRESFNRMAPTRNADMHARIITPEDLMLVVFETQRLFKRMREFSLTLH